MRGGSFAERHTRALGTLSGRGQVYTDGRWLAEVFYALTVTQETVTAGSECGSEEPLGRIAVCGQIEILGGEWNLRRRGKGPYRLRLSDGRIWTFRATPRRRALWTYDVTSAGVSGSIEGEDSD